LMPLESVRFFLAGTSPGTGINSMFKRSAIRSVHSEISNGRPLCNGLQGHASPAEPTGEFVLLATRPANNQHRNDSRLKLHFAGDERPVGRIEFAGFTMPAIAKAPLGSACVHQPAPQGRRFSGRRAVPTRAIRRPDLFGKYSFTSGTKTYVKLARRAICQLDFARQ